MPKFRSHFDCWYVVDVEAEDMYDADEKFRYMSPDEITANGQLVIHEYDTDEFPEEV